MASNFLPARMAVAGEPLDGLPSGEGVSMKEWHFFALVGSWLIMLLLVAVISIADWWRKPHQPFLIPAPPPKPPSATVIVRDVKAKSPQKALSCVVVPKMYACHWDDDGLRVVKREVHSQPDKPFMWDVTIEYSREWFNYTPGPRFIRFGGMHED